MNLFVQKVQILAERRFYRAYVENGLHLRCSHDCGILTDIQLTVPDREAIDAWVVTFRQFIQNNDPISVGNMAKACDDPGVSQNWKDVFTFIRDRMNRWLNDVNPNVKLSVEGEILVPRTVLYTFIYGDIAHTSYEHRNRYEVWMDNGYRSARLQYEFCHHTLYMFGFLSQIAEITRHELAGQPVCSLDQVLEFEREFIRARREHFAQLGEAEMQE